MTEPASNTAVQPLPESTPTAKRFGRGFWVLNTIEMWERLAFYNLRVMAPIYIMQADNPGGLHLSASDKGTIYAWWAVFQSLLPIATGGFADRFGYKRTMGFAISLMLVGYLMIALLRDVPVIPSAFRPEPAAATATAPADGSPTAPRISPEQLAQLDEQRWRDRNNFWGFFLGILVLATGTAFFKPSIQGTLAHTLNKANSSVGWGIFYWVVNVGAFVGHYLPSLILTVSVLLPGPLNAAEHSQEAWRTLFLASALITGLNLLSLFAFSDVPSGASKTETVWQVLFRTVRDVFEPRLLAWLGIMSCFWLMMYQLWDLQPNFIADWVDSSALAERLTWLPETLKRAMVQDTNRGPMIPQQVLLSANALFIILGVIGMAWITRHMRTLTAMLFGMILATVGIVVAGGTTNAYILILGVLFFSLGEMATGPKKSEYLALIAPPGKKGLYLGYVNIPVGVGVFLGSKIGGYVYGHYGEKAVLALRYLAEHTTYGAGRGWTGDVTKLEEVLQVPRTAALQKLQEVTDLDAIDATRLLWDTYHPQWHVWIPFAVVGVGAAVALWAFGRRARRWSDMNA